MNLISLSTESRELQAVLVKRRRGKQLQLYRAFRGLERYCTSQQLHCIKANHKIVLQQLPRAQWKQKPDKAALGGIFLMVEDRREKVRKGKTLWQ